MTAVTPGWLLQAFSSTVDIYQRIAAGVDEYGNVVYSDSLATTTRGLLQPVGTSEAETGRAGAGTYTLFLPAEVADLVDTFTAFVVDGTPYESVGPPETWRSMFAPTLHHVEISVTAGTA